MYSLKKKLNFVAVSRGLGSRLSWWPRLCAVFTAFDGWSASCGVAKNQNSTSFVSHRIYLGGCHFNPTSGCQVRNIIILPQFRVFFKICFQGYVTYHYVAACIFSENHQFLI